MNDPMPAIRSILGMPETEVEPVDHKAEAEEVLAYRGSLDAAVALAHATLYLAEQQRIANLIALGQFHIGNDLPPFRHLVMEPTGEYGVRPTPEIRKGLDL
jgi:hypothetical protein